MSKAEPAEIQLPRSWFGTRAEVRKWQRNVTSKVLRGTPIADAVGELESIRPMPVLVMIERDWEPEFDPCYHAYCTFTLLMERAENGDPNILRAVGDAMAVPWGVVALLGFAGTFAIPKERYSDYLRACVNVWPTLAALGPRFSGWGYATDVWQASRTQKFVLANLGVPNEVLATSTAEDFVALVRSVAPEQKG